MQSLLYDNVNTDKLWEMMGNKMMGNKIMGNKMMGNKIMGNKMMGNKIPKCLLNTIKCIYRNNKFRIKFNDGISEPIDMNKGVREGCGLSPVLFNMY